MNSSRLRQDLQNRVNHGGLSSAEFVACSTDIAQNLLAESPRCSTENVERISHVDLETLFDLYDERCFDGLCRRLINQEQNELSFRCSKRMTRAGGKTTSRIYTQASPWPGKREYEITISSFLLFDNFVDNSRPISVCGYQCEHRLHALQRILEHEMVHLIEMLIWDASSCAAKRFQGIASRWFQHSEFSHRLITPREKAKMTFGIQPGSMVTFEFEGKLYKGVVNRINKRATVLVPDRRGERYTDGRRYKKFYVPLSILKRC